MSSHHVAHVYLNLTLNSFCVRPSAPRRFCLAQGYYLFAPQVNKGTISRASGVAYTLFELVFYIHEGEKGRGGCRPYPLPGRGTVPLPPPSPPLFFLCGQ